MKQTLLYCILFAIFFTPPAAGQSKKSYTPILPENVRNGKQLERARAFTFKQFIEFYLEFGLIRPSKEHGGSISIRELYSDTAATYFAYGTDKYVDRLIKVRTADLSKVDYATMDGSEIEKRFRNEVVPEKDKKRVKNATCSTGFSSFEFDFEYVESENKVRITYKWKETCDFFVKLVNKTYIADYDLAGKTFKIIQN